MNLSKTLIAAAVASAPLMANALQLEDYLIANSSYDQAFISGNLTALEPAGDDDNDQVSYNYTVDADYQKVFSTLPRSWGYTLGLKANGSKPGTKTELVDDPDFIPDPNFVPDALNPTEQIPQVERDTESTEDWSVTAEGVVDTYFHESQYPKAFWFGQGNYRSTGSLPSDDISATIGLGYGRVYNATPLAKVIRIVEELNEEGLLTGPIPDSVALETAEIIDREEEFKSRFGEDEYRPDYYAAIETALARSGALRDGKFGALGALTVDNVLEDEPISTRRHGWVVRLGAGFQASDLTGLTDNDPKLLAQFEYAKPYGYKGQFINLFTFEPVFSDETLTAFRNDMSYTHEVTDMIDWINTWTMTYSDGEDADGNPLEITTHAVSSIYSFDLGNSLDYTVGLQLNQTDEDPNGPNSIGDSPEITFRAGFNYRLK